eukprot:scaffold7946_cov116-Isochrysis_galbana.AAC.9
MRLLLFFYAPQRGRAAAGTESRTALSSSRHGLGGVEHSAFLPKAQLLPLRRFKPFCTEATLRTRNAGC